MALKKWVRPEYNPELAKVLASEYQIQPMLAEILAARGLDSPAKAEEWLNPSVRLADPFLLPDMHAAAERIRAALEGGEKTVVYGDYDCDGICAATLLVSYLQYRGGNASAYIPSREGEGYGLNAAALREFASQGVQLVITVDNGISAVDEAELAAELGVDLVITDHHQPGERLPRAVAVVDPHRRDCDCPYRDYAGAGVAYQLVRALSAEERLPASYIKELLALTTVATIGDVVPLTGENRVLVKSGLKQLANCGNPGLAALLQVSSSGKNKINARTVAFGLVPRINAAGRMGCVPVAEQLLSCRDAQKAYAAAQELDRLNVQRKARETAILNDIYEQLRRNDSLLNRRVLVLSGERWDAGVIGIVSARVLERFGKPNVLLSIDGGTAVGSARSVPEFSMHRALTRCADLLERFGGHTQAAGLTIKLEHIPQLEEALNRYAEETLASLPCETLRIDRILEASDITAELIEMLEYLEPFGAGNPEPLFLIERAELTGILPLSGGKHVKLALRQNKTEFQALCFGTPTTEFHYLPGAEVDLLVRLELSEFMGRRTPSVRVEDLRPSGFDQAAWEQEGILCEALDSGMALSPEELSTANLSRADMVLVYAALKQENGCSGGLEQYFLARFYGKLNYVRFHAALDVLKELGLITVSRADGCVTVTDTPGKVELTASKRFCMLQKLEA